DIKAPSASVRLEPLWCRPKLLAPIQPLNVAARTGAEPGHPSLGMDPESTKRVADNLRAERRAETVFDRSSSRSGFRKTRWPEPVSAKNIFRFSSLFPSW